jgi:hypothetical protein
MTKTSNLDEVIQNLEAKVHNLQVSGWKCVGDTVYFANSVGQLMIGKDENFSSYNDVVRNYQNNGSYFRLIEYAETPTIRDATQETMTNNYTQYTRKFD